MAGVAGLLFGLDAPVIAGVMQPLRRVFTLTGAGSGFFACMMVLQCFDVLFLLPESCGRALERLPELLPPPRRRRRAHRTSGR